MKRKRNQECEPAYISSQKKERNERKKISSQEPESKIVKRYNVYALDLILKIEIYTYNLYNIHL